MAGGWKEPREKEPRCEGAREGAEDLEESRMSLVDFDGEILLGERGGLESAGSFEPGSKRSN